MLRSLFYALFLMLFAAWLAGCAVNNTIDNNEKYFRWVGDTEFDQTTDNKDFYLCDEDEIHQYHNFSQGFQYKGEKFELVSEINRKYITPENSIQSGYLRIRFVVNCNGETDRFRLLAMNFNYQEMEFEDQVAGQLLAIAKNLKGWPAMKLDDKPGDYYMYLIFKIENGHILEILP